VERPSAKAAQVAYLRATQHGRPDVVDEVLGRWQTAEGLEEPPEFGRNPDDPVVEEARAPLKGYGDSRDRGSSPRRWCRE
jgi:hypothetical protein